MLQSESDNSVTPAQSTWTADKQLQAIAYSMDALIPGLYVWFGALKVRIGGSLPEPTYPGTIHSKAGIALVLPNYRIYSTYQGNYDP
jgi:hypothetical protein